MFLFKYEDGGKKKKKEKENDPKCQGETAGRAAGNFCSLVCTQYCDGLGNTAAEAPAGSFAS